MNQNPLLTPSKIKNSAIAFDILKAEHFLPALENALTEGARRLQLIKSKPATYKDTIQAIEAAGEEVEFITVLFTNLLLAESHEDLEKLSLVMGPKMAAYFNDVFLDPELFAKVDQIYQSRDKLNLNAEQIRLVEKIHREFQRSGAYLSGQQKARLRQIDERLAQLSPKFRENILKATNAFELWLDKEQDLAGLPPTLRDMAREAAREKGQPNKWLITLQMPFYLPFLRFSEKRELREKIYRASGARALGGEFDNQAIVQELVQLMNEKAKLLGARNYAEYQLQLRMAESTQQVHQFLDKILDVAKPAAMREISEVQEFAKKKGFDEPLAPWDFLFYAERLKEERYSFDEESLRPYFKLENVVDGVFEHARRLFGLEFKLSKDYPTYHPDVNVYEVYKNSPDNKFIGLFYTDFFPRSTKSQGAWMTNYFEQGTFRGQKVRPHVSIVCNFTKPTPTNPSLLSFDEVETLFHEFGHALHGLLSQVDHRWLAGTNVYLDFVELPSQILENWAIEEESLRLYAKHYKSGETIPMELIERLKRSQKFLAAYWSVRQLNFAYLDLAWFSESVRPGESVIEFENRFTERTQLMPRIENHSISVSFSHIFGGGYSSGYYSYKWAEALDADAFELFKEKGIFNPEIAGRFEEHILSKGGSDHPMRLYENFRGRAPDPEALLRRDGLLKQ